MSKEIGLRKRIGLELYRKIHQERVRKHELRTLFWECTLRCNVACRHCGSDCRVSSVHPDMPIEDFLKVIDGILPQVNPNKVLVIFTGGEALVRPDIEQCGMELYRRGFPWGIVSNGLFLDRQRLDGLLKSGLHAATISLDGFEEAHNWLRRHPQSYSKAVEAIRMLSGEKEIVWDVVTCVNRKNIDDLGQFKEFLIANGVKDWRLFTIFPMGRAAQMPELQLDDEQFTRTLDFIRDTRKEGRIHASYGCEGFLGGYEHEVRDNFYECNAGIDSASVLIDGSISCCPSIRANFHQGNIYRDDFMDVWNNRFQPYRDRSWAKEGICKDCSLFRYCEGNGMHQHDDNGKLLVCHHRRILP